MKNRLPILAEVDGGKATREQYSLNVASFEPACLIEIPFRLRFELFQVPDIQLQFVVEGTAFLSFFLHCKLSMIHFQNGFQPSRS